MNRIEIDFNSRGSAGTVRGSLRRAGNVRTGESVVLVDSEDGVEFEARVVEVDHANGRVLYAPLWERVGFAEALLEAHPTANAPVRVQPATRGAALRRPANVTLPGSFLPGPFALPQAV